MVTRTIFRKIAKLQDELETKIKDVHSDKDKAGGAEKSLLLIDESIRTLKAIISSYHFADIAEEVYFFKKIKPQFISKFISYTTILDIESNKPNAGYKALKKYYEAEQQKLKDFHGRQSGFYSYYRRGATYLDHRYFVRNSYDLKMTLPLGLYNYDETFTTSHDQMVARILANDQLEEYLKTEIRNIGKENPETVSSSSPLVWSSSKAALVELVYAMHLTHCCNGGGIELSEMIRVFEKILTVNLGNFHKILNEISLRKMGRTKFLHLLAENLEQHFTDSDGK